MCIRDRGQYPGVSTLVESDRSARTPFLPSSPKRARSIMSPVTGVVSILKSPVCISAVSYTHLYKLQCRRGGFTPFPQLGSRMYMLFREKRTDRSAAAARYAAEALMDEPGAYVTGAEVTELDGCLLYTSRCV